jgi:arabinan endo-1,5-alpha-L-arabinosidase
MTFLTLILLLTTFASAHELMLDHDFPDPSIIKAHDGFYYAYATQGYTETATPKLLNLQLARSKDLRHWTHLGDALPIKPKWASRTQRFWAPHIHFANGLYYLYYSGEPNTDDGKCLGVATSKNPQGPFTDSGKPMVCGPSFSDIDPMLFNGHLYWGSAFDPVRTRKLDASLLKFESSSPVIPLVYPDRGPQPAPYLRLLEGAWVHEHEGYFYLFVSGEDCCGLPNPQYAVLVLRSKTALGPFEWKDGDPRQSVVLEGQGEYIATGHNALIKDNQGRLWSYYHGVDVKRSVLRTIIPGDRMNRRVMLRRRVQFMNGWPTFLEN